MAMTLGDRRSASTAIFDFRQDTARPRVTIKGHPLRHLNKIGQ